MTLIEVEQQNPISCGIWSEKTVRGALGTSNGFATKFAASTQHGRAKCARAAQPSSKKKRPRVRNREYRPSHAEKDLEETS